MQEAAQEDLTESQKELLQVQKDTFATKAMAGTEDCLNLAVFTPRVSPLKMIRG